MKEYNDSMKNKTPKQQCNDLIMAMNAIRPMSEEERRRDIMYGMVLTFLFVLIPMLLLIFLSLMNLPLWGIFGAAVSFGIGLAIGLNRRKQIIRNFCRYENGSDLTDISPAQPHLSEIMASPLCMVSILPQNEETACLLYNWLCARNLIDGGERLRAYTAEPAELKEYVSKQLPQTSLLMIPLEKREPDSWKQLYTEMTILRTIFLQSILKKEENKTDEEEKPVYEGEWADWVSRT